MSFLGGSFGGKVSNPTVSLERTQSTVNTTTTPLGAGATFTGTAEQNNSPNVGVSCFSDTDGTLYFDFSVDGTNWRTFPPTGFAVIANIHEFHTAVKLGRYFRIRFVNAGGAQSTFQLYTYFGDNFVPSVGPINFSIGDDADAIVTKSVISGIGNTTAQVTDHKALQVTFPNEGKSAFGEIITAEPTQYINTNFLYGITSLVESRANQSGTATTESSMLKLSTGAAANSSAEIRTKNKIRYNPGEGALVRFTSIFTTGVANSEQFSGIGDESNGFFFGYSGASFGILHRRGGSPEIRTLTVNTASTTAEDITITLDGDAEATVTVTNSGNTTTTANEIAAHDYSDTGRGWAATAVGSTVIFKSWGSGAKSGTYSLSSATSAVGTFAQTLAGSDPTETFIDQTTWNGLDKFDGNGITGVTLDPTKGNVYQIKYQWLGFGAVYFFIEDPDDGEYHLVHTIEYANTNTNPSLDNPSLPISIICENTTNTSDLIVRAASLSGFVEGKEINIGKRTGLKGSGVLTGTAVETPIYSFRVKEVFNSKLNAGSIKINYISAAVEHTKPVAINFYVNSTLTSASFSDVDAGVSIIQEDSSATAFSGGVLLFTIELGKTGNQVINLDSDMKAGIFSSGDMLTITAEPNSGNGAEANIAFNITEFI